MSTNLMQASEQWRKRPSDERFDSIEALAEAVRNRRTNSSERVIDLSEIRVQASGEDLLVTGPSGGTVAPSNWAFSQLCQRIGAPSGYLRDLPAPLAAECLNSGLAKSEKTDAQALLYRNGKPWLRALTSDRYSRIWDSEVADAIVRLQSSQPSWTFPQAFRSAAGNSRGIGNTAGQTLPTAFASDHDLFIFLCDYEKQVDAGDGSSLFRGFFVENSEVGAAKFSLTMFLFDMVCCNCIVWGAQDITEIAVRHVGRARERAFGGLTAELKSYAESATTGQVEVIREARVQLLGTTKEETISTLFAKRLTGLSKSVLTEAYVVAENTPRYGDPRSVWGMVNGITEVSQKTSYTDSRIELDRAAGKVLRLAA